MRPINLIKILSKIASALGDYAADPCFLTTATRSSDARKFTMAVSEPSALRKAHSHFNELRIVILHSVALSIISSFFHLSPGCGLHRPSCIHVFTKRERAESTTGRCILPASVWGGGGVDGGGRVTTVHLNRPSEPPKLPLGWSNCNVLDH